MQSVSGGPARQLTKGEAEGVLLDWSPDGKEIAYVSLSNGPTDVWKVPAAGGPATMLAGEPTFEETDPMWSRDGRWIYFRSNRSGRGEFWRVSPTGWVPEVVLAPVGVAPTLSRDGLAVCSIFPANPPNQRTLWSRSLEFKSGRAHTAFSGKRGFIHSNALTTDDKFLYFTWEEGASDVWVMDVAR